MTAATQTLNARAAETFTAAAPALVAPRPARRPRRSLSSRLELLGVLSLMLSSAAYAGHALLTLAA